MNEQEQDQDQELKVLLKRVVETAEASRTAAWEAWWLAERASRAAESAARKLTK